MINPVFHSRMDALRANLTVTVSVLNQKVKAIASRVLSEASHVITTTAKIAATLAGLTLVATGMIVGAVALGTLALACKMFNLTGGSANVYYVSRKFIDSIERKLAPAPQVNAGQEFVHNRLDAAGYNF